MSVDRLVDAIEDNMIWRATYPEEAEKADLALFHWVRTGHIECECEDRYGKRKESNAT